MKKAIIVALLFAMSFSLTACGKKTQNTNEPNSDESDVDSVAELELEPIDVEVYLEELGEIESVIKPETSNEVMDVTEITDLIDGRGFGEYPITAEYTMDGEYLGEDVLDIEDEKHPFYETYYVSASGEVWTIDVVNGTITAYPVTYNMESERDVTVIFSETKALTSYDGVTNTFFEFIPDESVMKVVVMDRINSETLDKLTREEIDRY